MGVHIFRKKFYTESSYYVSEDNMMQISSCGTTLLCCTEFSKINLFPIFNKLSVGTMIRNINNK